MPRFFLLILSGLLLAGSSSAQPLRVVTWKLDDLPPPPPTNTAPPVEVDPKRLRQIAAALKPLEADVIVLQGFPDKNAARKVTNFLKPGIYHVVSHSYFRRNGPGTPIVGPPITLLAKKQAVAGRSLEWRVSGRVEAPGGFVFAAFPHGTNTVCVYAAQMPFLQTNRNGQAQEQSNLRHRELAAQYLLHHADWLGSTLTNPLASVVFSGDFIPNPARMLEDNTIRVLEQAGFRSDLPALAAQRRAGPASLTNTALATVPLPDPLFARNADFSGSPVAVALRQFNTVPVTWDLVAKPPEIKPSARPGTEVLAAATPAARAGMNLAGDFSRYIWLAVGVILAALAMVVFFQWLAWRRWTKSLVPARQARNAVEVDFNGETGAAEKLGAPRAPAGVLTGPESETPDPEIVAWRHRALQAERRAQRAAALAQSGLKPHLLGLMREKLVFWLTSQRSHLLDSHENGTAQVMELEERLERIQAQFQERLVAKDQRIAELERELSAKDQFIHELLKARQSPEPATPAEASNQ